MAEELHIAVIGIAHFNKKDDIKSALLRVSDSIKPEARLVDFGGLSI
jgi:hypothetical protein